MQAQATSAVTTQLVTITPEAAKRMIAEAKGFTNRSVNPNKVRDYAADMKSGNWRVNGETMIFDEDGVLIDGQHRCLAVISAGIPVDFLCSFGVRRVFATTIDQGVSRTVAHSLQMDGVKNASKIITAARTLYDFRRGVDPECPTGKRHNTTNNLKTVAETESFLANDAPGLVDAVACVPGGVERAGSLAEFAAVMFELSLVESQSAALDWASGICGGLPSDDPRQVLRERFVDDRLAKAERRVVGRTIARLRQQRISLMVMSWNLWVGGHRASRKSFMLSADSVFPIVVPLPSSIAKGRPADNINRASLSSLRVFGSVGSWVKQ